MSDWQTILTPEEIDAYHRMTAIIDPAFAAQDRAWYQARTANQLRALASESWNCNEGGAYQLARSYLAKLESTKC